MNKTKLRIATRRSRLAVWQAEHVASALSRQYPGLAIELVPLSTRGDEIQDRPLNAVGGKGLFTKALEQAMLDSEADLAVHSMKDVPAVLPDGFEIAAVMQREDPHDAFISVHHASLEGLPAGASVGSSSLRRQSQLQHFRPDLKIQALRGNVETRLRKLDSGDFHAIILAAAGLHRLGLNKRIRQLLPTSLCLPAIGQGSIGIECLSADTATIEILRALNHEPTWTRTLAERALNRELQGNCMVPVAGYADFTPDGQLVVTGRVGSTDGSQLLESSLTGAGVDAEMLGAAVARELLSQGADRILNQTGA